MPRRNLVLAACLALSFAASAATAQTDWTRITPYTDIIWPSDTTLGSRVQIDGGKYFEWVSVDTVPLARVIAFAKTRYGRQWQGRVGEDIYDVLVAMGRPARTTVVLGLRDTASRQEISRSITMTNELRDQLILARTARGPVLPAGAVRAAPPPRVMSAQDIARDLDHLQTEMETRWAYLKTNNASYRPAIAALRAKGANGMPHAEFGLEVQRIIGMFIDGHAGVSGFAYAPGALPFYVETTEGRLLAVRHDRTGFVDSARPFLTRIDGRPVADWLSAAAPFVSQGSAQWMLRNEVRLLQRVQFMRGIMGVPTRGDVTLEFASRDGRDTRTVTMPFNPTGRAVAEAPRGGSRMLDGNIGYLRIESMNATAVSDVAKWMPQFRNTNGLIVDVRENGGGSRDGLRALFPYLMSPTDTPRVINAAKYRLHPDYGEDHLGGSRYMFRESWSGWDAAERAAIARFKTTFTPQWEPPAAEFSDWHYIVMSRRMNPGAFVYSKPVVVLLDEGSFSATDIFVAAFKGWRNVTLIGTPSGGGSARQVPIRLPVSQLSTTLASMASFQLNGRLFDGNGTTPDIVVHPAPEYFLINGPDVVLERALLQLRRVF